MQFLFVLVVVANVFSEHGLLVLSTECPFINPDRNPFSRWALFEINVITLNANKP